MPQIPSLHINWQKFLKFFEEMNCGQTVDNIFDKNWFKIKFLFHWVNGKKSIFCFSFSLPHSLSPIIYAFEEILTAIPFRHNNLLMFGKSFRLNFRFSPQFFYLQLNSCISECAERVQHVLATSAVNALRIGRMLSLSRCYCQLSYSHSFNRKRLTMCCFPGMDCKTCLAMSGQFKALTRSAIQWFFYFFCFLKNEILL